MNMLLRGDIKQTDEGYVIY